MALKAPHETFICTADDLTAFWRVVVGTGGFAYRSLWMIFLAADGELLPTIVPIDDIPIEPDEQLVRNLVKIIDGLRAEGVASVALMLCRPGPSDMLDADRHWAAALRGALGPQLSTWPIHLGTSDRVQAFARNDVAGA